MQNTFHRCCRLLKNGTPPTPRSPPFCRPSLYLQIQPHPQSMREKPRSWEMRAYTHLVTSTPRVPWHTLKSALVFTASLWGRGRSRPWNRHRKGAP